jgi:hypothetical protein
LREDRDLRIVVALAQAAGRVATFCDRVEHGESAERRVVSEAGRLLRETAFEYARQGGLDLLHLYAARLGGSERSHVLARPMSFDGERAVRTAASLRELQLAQVEHDREFRPDVFGLSRYEQLRHCALHLAKLVGSAAELHEDESQRSDFDRRRLPDVLLFGLKLATLADERLAEEPLEQATPQPASALVLQP